MSHDELPKNWMPELSSVSLAISNITYECYLWDVPGSRYKGDGGYIKFTGAYAYGSAGTNDAMFIRWCIHQFLDFSPVAGLIIDFRELYYVWGNDLEVNTWEMPDSHVCIVVPSKEENEKVYEAYKWLGEERLRTDLATAFKDIVRVVRRSETGK